ncbi:MAG TPA: trans-aconitate 2-methyltransferase [Candidatus Dormibacteraeota bacterium]|nr:trans-aconitate 2-methyltransferase [Candidatus Dormibacteraeota bacterium]
MTTWDPEQYLRYHDERSRPFGELVARIGATRPGYVVDMGCGTAELTATLLDRWPGALVEGVDSSQEMISAAAAPDRPDRLRLTLCDAREWLPGRPVDVLLSNAMLQWLPEHVDLLGRWVGSLAPGAWLAFQVPGNDRSPSHVILKELCRSPHWRGRVGDTVRDTRVLEPEGYLERLAGLGCAVDAWETTYLHLLAGPDPVLEWVKGSALRPVLDRLTAAEERDAFLAEYAAALRAAYPAHPYGTVLPFRRLFVVARRP